MADRIASESARKKWRRRDLLKRAGFQVGDESMAQEVVTRVAESSCSRRIVVVYER